jgi:putative transposase
VLKAASESEANEKIKREWRELIASVRSEHPAMGLRTIYENHKPEGVGRDAFLRFGASEGLLGKKTRKPNYRGSNKSDSKFENLLCDKTLTDINQVWTSDTTYYRMKGKFYYITFVIDLYSRKIIGHHVATSLEATETLAALDVALSSSRLKNGSNGLIHHSDRGSQYRSELYTSRLKSLDIAISMCHCVYENAHVERVNNTIKNQYLKYKKPTTYDELVKIMKKIVYSYNETRPHRALNRLSPTAYESSLSSVPMSERTQMPLYMGMKTQRIEEQKKTNER